MPGADGYILSYYNAKDPGKCIKTRYAKGNSKIILGFTNGVEYLVSVKAFYYEGDKEIVGKESGKMSFVPICMELKAQNTICLSVGEEDIIKCEYKNTEPMVRYRCDDKTICEVDVDGTVKGISPGVASVTCLMETGEKTTVRIMVERSLNKKNKPRAVVMLAGDLMCSLVHQRRAAKRGFDFSSSLEQIKPILSSADYSVGVLETVCFDNSPYEMEKKRTDKGSPNCNSPSSFIYALKKGGFKGVVTANNHNCYCGGEGLIDTVNHIKSAGMDNIGTVGNNPVVVDLNGIRVGIIAFNMVSNGLEDACDSIGGTNFIGKYTPEEFGECVRNAIDKGAEYIIAYQHFGMMNSTQIRNTQRKTAKEMAEMGADFIVGSHPHVIQKAELIKTEDDRTVPCVYSLGNALTSMKEMKENTESALIRLELTRGKEGIKADYSYIPITSADNDDRVIMRPLITGLSEEDLITRERIAISIGDKIKPYKEKIMLQGSVVLRKIFENFDICDADSNPLILSPVSLMSKEHPDTPYGEKNSRLRFDFYKSFEEYLQNSNANHIAVDFYTAASVSCYKLDDSLYTGSQLFLNSRFYKENRDKFQQIKQPIEADMWRPAVREYAKLLKKRFDSKNIILIRVRFPDKSAKKNQFRNTGSKPLLNKRIYEMEQYFIDTVNPTVIDISSHYFIDAEDSSAACFEPSFDKHCRNIIRDIIFKNTDSFYFEKNDLSLWVDRTAYYFDNMTARAYQGWLLDNKSAADLIMRYSSAEFITANKDFLIKLKQDKTATLTDVRRIFENDGTAKDIIRAANAIDLLLKGDISKEHSEYAIIFEKNLNAVTLMAKLLSEETGYGVTKENAEMVFLLKNNPKKLARYYSIIGQVKIDIWGSCISRETANRAGEKLQVNKYIFKQPAVLLDEPDIDYEIPGAEKFNNNAWRRRTVFETFTHKGREILQNSGSDWLMVVFYDLICNMVLFKEGLFEVDDFIKRTAFYKRISFEVKPTYLFEERTMEQCLSGMDSFAKFVSDRYGKNIVLVKIDLKDKYITLDKTLAELSDNDNTFSKKVEFLS